MPIVPKTAHTDTIQGRHLFRCSGSLAIQIYSKTGSAFHITVSMSEKLHTIITLIADTVNFASNIFYRPQLTWIQVRKILFQS